MLCGTVIAAEVNYSGDPTKWKERGGSAACEPR